VTLASPLARFAIYRLPGVLQDVDSSRLQPRRGCEGEWASKVSIWAGPKCERCAHRAANLRDIVACELLPLLNERGILTARGAARLLSRLKRDGL
jgi:hypothetical protein